MFDWVGGWVGGRPDDGWVDGGEEGRRRLAPAVSLAFDLLLVLEKLLLRRQPTVQRELVALELLLLAPRRNRAAVVGAGLDSPPLAGDIDLGQLHSHLWLVL
jgi:hypothetical protein